MTRLGVVLYVACTKSNKLAIVLEMKYNPNKQLYYSCAKDAGRYGWYDLSMSTKVLLLRDCTIAKVLEVALNMPKALEGYDLCAAAARMCRRHAEAWENCTLYGC